MGIPTKVRLAVYCVCCVTYNDFHNGGLGCYVEGQKDGYGKYVSMDGNGTYEGEWKQDEMHGYGHWNHPNGDKHDGFYENGLPHGQGHSLWANGDEYIGFFSKGKMDGQGKLVSKNTEDGSESRYDGGWQRGKRHGRGHWKLSNKDEYKGDFKRGLKHGQGCYTLADGTVLHDGKWKDDQPYDHPTTIQEVLDA